MSNQYIVGGAVRDVLLGRVPKDLDYVWVGATPNEMIALGMNQVGADFPVFLDSAGDEHALARKERKVELGYNGFQVDFDSSVTLEDDLIRRDLTINAMAVPVEDWKKFTRAKKGNSKFVIDPFNGLDDLKAKTLRHVSDAFAEDPVRVLRVARFAARYEFDIAVGTLLLMKKLVDDGELDTLVPERVWSEMERALTETNPMAFFKTLDYCGAADKLFPEFDFNDFFETNLADTPADASLRFALACLNMKDDEVNEMCVRLTAPSDFRKRALRGNTFVELFRKALTAERVIETLDRISAFQDAKNANEALLVVEHSAFNTESFLERKALVASVLSDVTDVRFADLTTTEQQTLKGPAVGAALRELRLLKVADLL